MPFFVSLARPERLRRRSATAAPRWGRCGIARAPRCRNVLPRWRAGVELPTFWFVGRLGISRSFKFNKLDGPPSLYVPLNFVKSCRVALQPYARYEIGARWFLDAGRRYLSTGEVTMDGEGAATSRVRADYEPWSATLGIGWRF